MDLVAKREKLSRPKFGGWESEKEDHMKTLDSALAANELEGGGLLGGAARAWLRDHSVAAVALGVTLLAAAGYCVQRSWLFGWYQAAGIPPFAHSWSVQDVVMLGVLNLKVWVFGLGAVALLGVVIYVELVAFAYAESKLSELLQRKVRQEVQDESKKKLPQALQRLGAHTAVCAMFVLSAALLYCLIALAVILFSSKPREFGREQYLEIQGAAEKAFKTSNAPRDLPMAAEGKSFMQAKHQYVQVSVGIGESTSRHCGWLVLQNGEHMFLLTRAGPLFLNSSGLGSSWQPVDMEKC